MGNNIGNKTSGWATKNGRNGINPQGKLSQGSGNPSMQDKDTAWDTDNGIMKAKANMDMTPDGGIIGHDEWKGGVSC